MPDPETLLVDRRGPVATVRFNRPQQLNAFTPAMNLALADLVRGLRDDESVRVVIFTGAGRAFSAGADLKALAASGGRSAEVGYERVKAAGLRIGELKDFPKPTIAAVNGVAAGFACGLAFACDIVLAAESARFAITFSKIGYVPDGGVSYFLPRLAGLPRAKELFFRAEPISAEEAVRSGLANRVVSDARLMEEASALAEEIARRPAAALRMGKAILNRSLAADYATVIELEAEAQGFLGTTEEHRQAVREFVERKRRD
jgi:2-(1,2-epoxy-1,2-dihydrophenyl)acetyl-CoA isomerase